MADLVCEAYDVCYGTGLSDPSPTVVSLPYRTRAAARAAAAALNAQAREGRFDPNSVDATRVFFVRARPGLQTLPVPTAVAGDPPTATEVRAALESADVMVPVYVRHLNPTGNVLLTALRREVILEAMQDAER